MVILVAKARIHIQSVLQGMLYIAARKQKTHCCMLNRNLALKASSNLHHTCQKEQIIAQWRILDDRNEHQEDCVIGSKDLSYSYGKDCNQKGLCVSVASWEKASNALFDNPPVQYKGGISSKTGGVSLRIAGTVASKAGVISPKGHRKCTSLNDATNVKPAVLPKPHLTVRKKSQRTAMGLKKAAAHKAINKGMSRFKYKKRGTKTTPDPIFLSTHRTSSNSGVSGRIAGTVSGRIAGTVSGRIAGTASGTAKVPYIQPTQRNQPAQRDQTFLPTNRTPATPYIPDRVPYKTNGISPTGQPVKTKTQHAMNLLAKQTIRDAHRRQKRRDFYSYPELENVLNDISENPNQELNVSGIKPKQVSLKNLFHLKIHRNPSQNQYHPNIQPYLTKTKYNTYNFNIIKIQRAIVQACRFLSLRASQGQTFLFISTKKVKAHILANAAEKCNSAYINQKWLGGFLTNWKTIRTAIATLNSLDMRQEIGLLKKLPKKELSVTLKRKAKLEHVMGGLKAMRRLPNVLVIFGQTQEHHALRELRQTGIVAKKRITRRKYMRQYNQTRAIASQYGQVTLFQKRQRRRFLPELKFTRKRILAKQKQTKTKRKQLNTKRKPSITKQKPVITKPKPFNTKQNQPNRKLKQFKATQDSNAFIAPSMINLRRLKQNIRRDMAKRQLQKEKQLKQISNHKLSQSLYIRGTYYNTLTEAKYATGLKTTKLIARANNPKYKDVVFYSPKAKNPKMKLKFQNQRPNRSRRKAYLMAMRKPKPGLPLSQRPKHPDEWGRNLPIRVNDQEYTDIEQATEETGIKRSLLFKQAMDTKVNHITLNLPNKSAAQRVPSYTPTWPITVNGRSYPTILAAACATNKKSDLLWERAQDPNLTRIKLNDRKHRKSASGVKANSTPIRIDTLTYSSVTEALRETKIAGIELAQKAKDPNIMDIEFLTPEKYKRLLQKDISIQATKRKQKKKINANEEPNKKSNKSPKITSAKVKPSNFLAWEEAVPTILPETAQLGQGKSTNTAKELKGQSANPDAQSSEQPTNTPPTPLNSGVSLTAGTVPSTVVSGTISSKTGAEYQEQSTSADKKPESSPVNEQTKNVSGDTEEKSKKSQPDDKNITLESSSTNANKTFKTEPAKTKKQHKKRKPKRGLVITIVGNLQEIKSGKPETPTKKKPSETTEPKPKRRARTFRSLRLASQRTDISVKRLGEKANDPKETRVYFGRPASHYLSKPKRAQQNKKADKQDPETPPKDSLKETQEEKPQPSTEKNANQKKKSATYNRSKKANFNAPTKNVKKADARFINKTKQKGKSKQTDQTPLKTMVTKQLDQKNILPGQANRQPAWVIEPNFSTKVTKPNLSIKVTEPRQRSNVKLTKKIAASTGPLNQGVKGTVLLLPTKEKQPIKSKNSRDSKQKPILHKNKKAAKPKGVQTPVLNLTAGQKLQGYSKGRLKNQTPWRKKLRKRKLSKLRIQGSMAKNQSIFGQHTFNPAWNEPKPTYELKLNPTLGTSKERVFKPRSKSSSKSTGSLASKKRLKSKAKPHLTPLYGGVSGRIAGTVSGRIAGTVSGRIAGTVSSKTRAKPKDKKPFKRLKQRLKRINQPAFKLRAKTQKSSFAPVGVSKFFKGALPKSVSKVKSKQKIKPKQKEPRRIKRVKKDPLNMQKQWARKIKNKKVSKTKDRPVSALRVKNTVKVKKDRVPLNQLKKVKKTYNKKKVQKWKKLHKLTQGKTGLKWASWTSKIRKSLPLPEFRNYTELSKLDYRKRRRRNHPHPMFTRKPIRSVSVVDQNGNPDMADLMVPMNYSAATISLVLNLFVDAIRNGQEIYNKCIGHIASLKNNKKFWWKRSRGRKRWIRRRSRSKRNSYRPEIMNKLFHLAPGRKKPSRFAPRRRKRSRVTPSRRQFSRPAPGRKRMPRLASRGRRKPPKLPRRHPSIRYRFPQPISINGQMFWSLAGAAKRLKTSQRRLNIQAYTGYNLSTFFIFSRLKPKPKWLNTSRRQKGRFQRSYNPKSRQKPNPRPNPKPNPRPNPRPRPKPNPKPKDIGPKS